MEESPIGKKVHKKTPRFFCFLFCSPCSPFSPCLQGEQQGEKEEQREQGEPQGEPRTKKTCAQKQKS